MDNSNPNAPDPNDPSSLTPTDQGPAIVLTAAITLTIALLTVLLSLGRRQVLWRRVWHAQDILLLLATVTDIVLTAVALVAVQAGLGNATDHTPAPATLERALTASYALFFCVNGFASSAFAALVYTVGDGDLFRKAILVQLGTIGAWSLAGVIRFAADTNNATQIFSSKTSWLALAAIELAIHATHLLTILIMILPLTLPLTKKLSSILTTTIFLPTISTLAILRIILLVHPTTFSSTPSPLRPSTYLILLLLESALSVMSAACPGFATVAAKLSTGFLVADHNLTTKGLTSRFTGNSNSRTNNSSSNNHARNKTPALTLTLTSQSDTHPKLTRNLPTNLTSQSEEMILTPPAQTAEYVALAEMQRRSGSRMEELAAGQVMVEKTFDVREEHSSGSIWGLGKEVEEEMTSRVEEGEGQRRERDRDRGDRWWRLKY